MKDYKVMRSRIQSQVSGSMQSIKEKFYQHKLNSVKQSYIQNESQGIEQKLLQIQNQFNQQLQMDQIKYTSNPVQLKNGDSQKHIKKFLNDKLLLSEQEQLQLIQKDTALVTNQYCSNKSSLLSYQNILQQQENLFEDISILKQHIQQQKIDNEVIQQHKQHIGVLNTEIIQQQQKLIDGDNEIQHYVTQMSLQQAEIKNLTYKLENQQNLYKQLNTDYQELRENSDINKLLVKHKQVVNQLNSCIQLLKDVKQELCDENTTQSEKINKMQEITNQLVEAKQTIFQQQFDLNDLQQKYNLLNGNYKLIFEYKNSVEQQLSDQKQHVSQLLQQKHDFSNEITQLTNQINSQNTQIEQQKNKLDKYKQTVKKLETLIFMELYQTKQDIMKLKPKKQFNDFYLSQLTFLEMAVLNSQRQFEKYYCQQIDKIKEQNSQQFNTFVCQKLVQQNQTILKKRAKCQTKYQSNVDINSLQYKLIQNNKNMRTPDSIFLLYRVIKKAMSIKAEKVVDSQVYEQIAFKISQICDQISKLEDKLQQYQNVKQLFQKVSDQREQSFTILQCINNEQDQLIEVIMGQLDYYQQNCQVEKNVIVDNLILQLGNILQQLSKDLKRSNLQSDQLQQEMDVYQQLISNKDKLVWEYSSLQSISFLQKLNIYKYEQ